MGRKYSISTVILLLILFLQLSAHAAEPQRDVEKKAKKAPDSKPIITNIDPTHGTEGIYVIISGQNFNPSKDKNKVTFNQENAEVKAATKENLVVRVPKGCVFR